MNSDQWQKAKDLFEAALRCPPDKRRRFLDENCDGDDSLRREVESLLFSYNDADSFMEQPAVGEVAEIIAGQKSPTGKTLGHYKILSQIGAGGMGEVYLAKDKKLDRQVAIKILNEQFSRDESNLQRFTQEAKSASSLNHPHILVIYEIGTEGNTHYIASEFIEGKTLREHFKQSPMKLSEVLDISIQIAGALTAAHAAHIIHRDIKPENIMVRPDGYVKILDFGLAKLVEQQKSRIGLEDETVKQSQTAKGVILGTVNYMSPEQAKGEKVDARTDIFSFGIVIYEMITGRTPFAGDSMSETFANLMNAEPQPLARYAANVPGELQHIVSKMLRKNKDERYHTMKGLFADLKDLRENLAFGERLEKSYSPDAENETNQFQATPGDANLQPAATDYSFVRQIKRQRPLAVIALLVLLAAIGLGVWYFDIRPANTKQIESIAVLPFENRSGNADVEYLSDGMTETLINSLSQLPKLNVKSRSSVFRYKGKEADVPTISKELNVQAIVHGRVIQRGDELTLFLSLVDAKTENQLWGKQYNRKLTNLLSLQTEIARDVSDNLKTKLTGADEQKLTRSYTANPEAYRLYLQGRYFWNKRTEKDIRKSIEYFDQAVVLDPNYALAYTGISDAYSNLGSGINFSPILPAKSLPKAKEAALRALEIDNMLGEAHVSLGWIKERWEWDFATAQSEYMRAIELNPDYATAHHRYGVFLGTMGRFDESIAALERARQLDPLSLIIATDLSLPYFWSRRHERAIEVLRKALEIDANFARAHAHLAQNYRVLGRYEEAIAEQQKAFELSGGQFREDGTKRVNGTLAVIYAAAGRKSEAQKILDEMTEAEKHGDYLYSFGRAVIYAELGDKERAFAWLEKAFAERFSGMTELKVAPTFDSLRDDPRFQDLLRRVGFPQ